MRQDKGYCFITPADGGYGGDLFAHARAFPADIRFDCNLIGRIVEFEAGVDAKTGKHRAISVRLVDDILQE